MNRFGKKSIFRNLSIGDFGLSVNQTTDLAFDRAKMRSFSKKKGCPFCNWAEPVLENPLAYAIYDKYPVTDGHMLVVSKRHYPDFFESTGEEIEAIFDLVRKIKTYLDARYRPHGYNVGINCGTSAGQTIMHLHIHVIPRYKGDMDDPTGGVRGVIPARQKYP